MPPTAIKYIIIQQDNAKPPINHNDPEFVAAADGFTIQLICQPPNTPDSNVNDLGFFRAIQSLQDDKLKGCYTEIVKVRGSNNYKIPHMNKARSVSNGTIRETIEVEEGLVRDCLEYIRLPGNNDGASYNIALLVSATGYWENMEE